jgi:hypothetical protein
MYSGKACYHSAKNLLSFRLLYTSIKIIICKTVIHPLVLYECGTRSLTLREEHALKGIENRVLRRIIKGS